MAAMMDAEWPEKLPLVTTARLRAGGRSPRQIETLVRRGKLVRIGRGLPACAAIATAFVSHRDGDHVLRAAAAVVVQAGRGSVVSHRSAAVVHGIDLIGSCRLGRHDDRSWSCKATRPQGRRSGVHVYTTPMLPEHVTAKFSLPGTTVARTVIDLSGYQRSPMATCSRRDSAIRKRMTSKAQLRPYRRRALADAVPHRLPGSSTSQPGSSSPNAWSPSRELPSTTKVCQRLSFRSGSRRRTRGHRQGRLLLGAVQDDRAKSTAPCQYDDDPSRARAQLAPR